MNQVPICVVFVAGNDVQFSNDAIHVYVCVQYLGLDQLPQAVIELLDAKGRALVNFLGGDGVEWDGCIVVGQGNGGSSGTIIPGETNTYDAPELVVLCCGGDAVGVGDREGHAQAIVVCGGGSVSQGIGHGHGVSMVSGVVGGTCGAAST